MNGFLLDTNIHSEFARPLPNAAVSAWVNQLPPSLTYLSVISNAELIRGATRHPDHVQKLRLERWAEVYLRRWFAEHMLPVSLAIAQRAGRTMGEQARNGRVLELADALIAATAAENNLILATRNTRDFVHLGLELFNPWSDPPPKLHRV